MSLMKKTSIGGHVTFMVINKISQCKKKCLLCFICFIFKGSLRVDLST